MRILIVILGTLLATAAILKRSAELDEPAPDSWFCRLHLCRTVPLVNAALNTTPDAAQQYHMQALRQEPGNPYRWAELGENALDRSELAMARLCMTQAGKLGRDIPAVLMRVANFHFRMDEPRLAIPFTHRVLETVPAYDGIIFMYYDRSGVPLPELLETAIPPEARTAQAWLRHQFSTGSPAETEVTWEWLFRKGFIDDRLAGEYAYYLVGRKEYDLAAARWKAWIGARSPAYRAPELLFNRQWRSAPIASPFDWRVQEYGDVQTVLGQGLTLRFNSQENLAYEGVSQMAVVEPGEFLLTAEVAGEDLTTNEGPHFRVYDAENPARLDVTSEMILGTRPRGPLELRFTVPSGTRLVNVQLRRKQSMKFDHKIKGTLHVYNVSMRMINSRIGSAFSAGSPARGAKARLASPR